MIGYRSWDFDKENRCLIGSYGAEWHNKMVKSDKEPARENQSGIYASKNFDDVMSGVCGAVDLSGKILVHEDGIIRAQYSTILWLTCLNENDDVGLNETLVHFREEDVRQFCEDKDIVFIDSKLVNNKIEEIRNDLGLSLLGGTLTISAMDEMFATISHQSPLDYSSYAKVKFKMLRDSLDYQILSKLSDKVSIFYDSLLGFFNSHKNYFLMVSRRSELEEAFNRIKDFVDYIETSGETYVLINDKGLEVLDHIDKHCYYSYNTKEARFVHRRNYHTRGVFAYKINGKYKIIYKGKVSGEFSSLEDVAENHFFTFLCDCPLIEEEVSDIAGYYVVWTYGIGYKSNRVNYMYLCRDDKGNYPRNICD
jgi:hypothetical protein